MYTQGSARCVGSVQHLKSRFGGGYMLEARLLPSLPVSDDEGGAATTSGAGTAAPGGASASAAVISGGASSSTTASAVGAGSILPESNRGIADSSTADTTTDSVLAARVCDLMGRVIAVCPAAKMVESEGTRLEISIPR